MIKEALAFATALVTSPVAVWRVVVLMVFGGHVAWACGWLPGLSGFALAAEVEDKIAAVNTKLANIETKQNIALRLSLAEEICRLYVLREDARGNSELWQTLNDTFNSRQEDYRSVNNGAPYNVTECSAAR